MRSRLLFLLVILTISCSHELSRSSSDGGVEPPVEAGNSDAAVDHQPAVDDGLPDGGGTSDEGLLDTRSADAAYQDITIGTVYRVGPNEAYKTIAEALEAATTAPATVLVTDGTYSESLKVKTGGSSETDRLLIRAEHTGGATISHDNGVLHIDAPWVTVSGFVLDGLWGDHDIVQATDAADHLILHELEIKNSLRDGVDIGGGNSGGCRDVLIDGCKIHHMLGGSTQNQVDAHCIVATDFRKLTIRDTEAYYCSGDCVQVGTDRDPWDELVIEGCHLWTGPLPASAAGFNAGDVPGENALDTKARLHSAPWRGTIELRDSRFGGFDPANAYIANRAALNLKDQITGTVERCMLYDNEIGLRVRGAGTYGGVHDLLVKNTLLYRNRYHVRVEDDAENVRWLHNTFGELIDDQNVAVSIDQKAPYEDNTYKNGGGGDEGPGWETDNNLYISTVLPKRSTGSGDLATIDPTTFVNLAQHDYHLAKQLDSYAVGVVVDLDNKPRSHSAPDVGAYELP